MIFGFMTKKESDALRAELKTAQERIAELEKIVADSQPKRNQPKGFRLRTLREAVEYLGQQYDERVVSYTVERDGMRIWLRKPYSKRGTDNYVVGVSKALMRNVRTRTCEFEFLVSMNGGVITPNKAKKEVSEGCIDFYNEAHKIAREIAREVK